MARDTLIHGRKTNLGIDLTFGKTTATPCGKTRPRERTSTDVNAVTCPTCRAWYAKDEADMADMADAAARIKLEHLDDDNHFPYSPHELAEIARDHRVKASRWAS